jgi:phosphoribosylamine--glycine ligase
MKVLIVGAGGREHALAWKISQSNKVNKIYCAPGNAGMAQIAQCVDIKVGDIIALADFAQRNNIDLTVVGPEESLVRGIVDEFENRGLRIFGPNKACAEFENSKAFTKKFLEKYYIPTAKYAEFISVEDALENIGIFGYPTVIKADGLAAGKGVIIAQNEQEATKAIDEIMMQKKFGASGDKIVLEEFLTGTEASMLCFVDGETIIPMESARDYKNIYDGNKGPNTGGMGSYSPNELFDDTLKCLVDIQVLRPIIDGMKKENLDYKGVLFIGLMVKDGMPKVLEFNVRFGDPETQSVLMRLDTDLVDIMHACIDKKLSQTEICWDDRAAVCVVMASGGYPGDYEKGKVIKGLNCVQNTIVFHAGTKLNDEHIVTNGGRVLGVCAIAKSVIAARKEAYIDVEKISFEQVYYRRDIAK